MACDLRLSLLVQGLLPWGVITRQCFHLKEAPALELAFLLDLLVDFWCNLFYYVCFSWERCIAR